MNLKKQEKIVKKESSLSISQIAENLGIDVKQVEEGIINSFRESYCQGENAGADLEFEFSGELSVFRKYKIVPEVIDSVREISQSDPSISRESRVIGEYFFLPLCVKNFSSSLIQDIGRRIRGGIREIRRKKQLESFKEQRDQLVRGRVSRFDSRLKVGIVELEDGNIGYWPENEWQDNRSFSSFFTRAAYFLISQIEENDNGCQIFLTRNSERFLQKIMELEIPEIKSGIIKICYIIRIPHLVSKVVVESLSPSVDPVGTCVGFSAGRIISISKNTYPEERVDIVAWNEDKKQLLFSLLLPVRVISLLEKGNEWLVTIPSFYLTNVSRYKTRLLRLIVEIDKCLQKKIRLLPYDDDAESSQVYVWNGNISYLEYRKLVNNNRRMNENNSNR